jgi:hypothetical protein
MVPGFLRKPLTSPPRTRRYRQVLGDAAAEISGGAREDYRLAPRGRDRGL